MLNVVVALVGFYCMVESISAAAEMHKGDRLCRFGKYMLAGASGMYCITVAIYGHATFGMLLLVSAIALGVWPRTLHRLTGCRRNTDFNWVDRYPQ